MQQQRGRGLKVLVAVSGIAVLAAAAIGAWKIGSVDTSGGAGNENRRPAAGDRAGGACAPGIADTDAAETPGTPQRLTNVVQGAAELLRVNGAAWGPQVATGTELSISEAFAQASSVPGDATVVEMEWLRQAERDGVYDDPNRPLEVLVRHIESTTITDTDLAEHLGPNRQVIIETVGAVAAVGFDEYVAQVRVSPAMRAADALDLRARLRETAVAAGLQSQWDRSQELVAAYFQQCIVDALIRREPEDPMDEYVRDWDLAEALARDAVAAAFFAESSGPDRELTEILARGLRIVRAPQEFDRDDSLTRSVQPGENLHPDDAALLDAEEPFLDDK